MATQVVTRTDIGNTLLIDGANKVQTNIDNDTIKKDGTGKLYVDGASAAFVEAVQDAFGLAAAAGAGVTYNDALNAIGTAMGNLTFPQSVQNAGTVVTLVGDAAAPGGDQFYGTDAAGVKGWQAFSAKVVAAAMAAATVELQDLSGNVILHGFV